MEKSNKEDYGSIKEGLEQMIRGLEIISRVITDAGSGRSAKPDIPKNKIAKETVEEAEKESQVTETAEDVLLGREDIREVLVKKTKQGKGADVKELLGIFHAERLSDVKEEHFRELFQMAMKL